MKNKLKFAYTLAEVVIVMLIIAVVVSISIKITKSKLDNITSYTYYTAYTTLKSVTSEMLKDFDADEEDYGVVQAVDNNNLISKIKYFFISYKPFVPYALAACGSCPSGWRCVGSTCVAPQTPGGGDSQLDTPMPMPCDHTYDCASGTRWDPVTCKCVYDDTPYPPQSCLEKICMVGFIWDAENCMCVRPNDSDTQCVEQICNLNYVWSPEECKCIPKLDSGSDDASCPSVIPCGKQCSAATGYVLQDIPNFSRTCENQHQQWSEEQCACIPVAQTISRNGEGFCKLFVSYANTSQLAEGAECNGSIIDTNEREFFDKEPDFILRNGMRLYNVHQNPAKIPVLAGNSKGNTYIDADDNEVDIDEYGYTFYIDIDGASGNSRLWEDVYPFYVTLSGTLVPAYDLNNPELSGGDSKLHLQTSVLDEFADGNGRHVSWITKSKAFKESACAMGLIKASTPYCNTAPAVGINAQCALQNHDCRLKTVMPIKFFGH